MTEQTNDKSLDRKDVKILAYKEKVSELMEREADLRVEVTFLSQQLREAHQRLAKLEAPDTGAESDAKTQDS